VNLPRNHACVRSAENREIPALIHKFLWHRQQDLPSRALYNPWCIGPTRPFFSEWLEKTGISSWFIRPFTIV
jgi:hypothetical protein